MQQINNKTCSFESHIENPENSDSTNVTSTTLEVEESEPKFRAKIFFYNDKQKTH